MNDDRWAWIDAFNDVDPRLICMLDRWEITRPGGFGIDDAVTTRFASMLSLHKVVGWKIVTNCQSGVMLLVDPPPAGSGRRDRTNPYADGYIDSDWFQHA